MRTFLRREHSIASQLVMPFTGEGAYHGSTRPRPPSALPAPLPPMVEEMRPRTAERLASKEKHAIEEFKLMKRPPIRPSRLLKEKSYKPVVLTDQ